jgi:hypothetical protein
VLYLALSCLQGRPQAAAAAELWALEPDGLQLTPGCAPSSEPLPSAPLRTHHGFSDRALRARVWDAAGELRWTGDSVHPPRSVDAPPGWTPRAKAVYETMYPGYADLDTGDALDRAMDDGLSLAVDIAHLELQRTAGVLSDATWRRLQDYDRVVEVHVSASVGAHDRHAPLHAGVFGLGWARARFAAGAPVVLESYMHRTSVDDRRRQMELIRP